MSTTVSHTTRSFPRLSYEKVKNDILGSEYELSLVFVGEKRGREINRQSRNKTYVPNVLSFPLSSKAGEIYITLAVAKREAPTFRHSYPKHVLYLFIHGLLHLKGLDHGSKMDMLEEKYLRNSLKTYANSKKRT
ncbi:MAG: rRNA maturation RNase YbeY [Candidatus Paceibacterota bacterium]